jgi:endonuclease/exonuclease/phosphatase family metal-dependent hydrolase
LNTHLAAFSKDGTRREQVEQLEEELAALDEDGHRFVLGGDFNLIPPDSEVTADFADVDCQKEDYEPTDYGDKVDVLQSMYDSYTPAIGLEEYRADNRPHLTYSADEEVFWTRKLDYLFTNGNFEPSSGLVHQNAERGGMKTIHRSDHAPLTAVLSE